VISTSRRFLVVLQKESVMTGYVANIEDQTLQNKDYRRVLFTGKMLQLVLMSIQPGEEIGMEVHEDHDQFLRVESGSGVAILNGERHDLKDGVAVVVPAQVQHNIINTSKSAPLKLYTLYSPPEHPEDTVQKTKADEKSHP
jgi:mannose-6-phosphate isomerase-like protein (cupin superfamily)